MQKRKKTESLNFNDMTKAKNILISWAFTLLCSPLLFLILTYIQTDISKINIKSVLSLYFLFLAFGALYAIPCLIILLSASYILKEHPYWNRATISITAIVFIFLSFLFADTNYYINIKDDLISLLLPVVYSALFVFSLYVFKK